jgi:hypothetical protein
MLKSGSKFIGKLFNKRSCNKYRTDTLWIHVYPSPEPSWMKKTANTAANWVYNNIDHFFQGATNNRIIAVEGNFLQAEKVGIVYTEWELNQDIADIALIDIQNSFSWILPGFVKKFAFRVRQIILLYLNTDEVNDEESQDWFDLKYLKLKTEEPHSIKITKFPLVFKDSICSKCLFISDWLKKISVKLRIFFIAMQKKRTYYLLGNFAPGGKDILNENQNNMIRGPDKVNLNPSFSFHKRI